MRMFLTHMVHAIADPREAFPRWSLRFPMQHEKLFNLDIYARISVKTK